MAAATGTGGEERECILGGFMGFRFSPTQKKKKNYISSFLAVVTIALSCNLPYLDATCH